mgnify:CR=1 FL=1
MAKNSKLKGSGLRKWLFIFFSILKSGKYAAYYVIWVKFLQWLLWPLDVVFALTERFCCRGQPTKDLPVVFVVGIQRTGSTIVSQFLAETFPLFPIGNFSTLFHRASYLPYRLFSRFRQRGRKKCYRNYYGISPGMFAIGDAYEYWDPWLGRDHYRLPDLPDEQQAHRLARHLSNIHRACGQPLITKNNRNSLMIRFFYRLFPHAFFVVVERTPLHVIRSTVKASQDFFGKGRYLWGLMPQADFDPGRYENLQEAATVQYLELEKMIHRQLDDLPHDAYIRIDYDDFCRNPRRVQQDIFKRLKDKYNLSQEQVSFRDTPFAVSKRLDNTPLDNQIRSCLRKWNDRSHKPI